MGIKIHCNKKNIDGFLKEMIELKEMKKLVFEKIQFWLDEIEKLKLSRTNKKQKVKEIIDLGNFIQSYNKEIIITAIGESPDFFIQEGKTKIGIELSDLVIRNSEKEKEGILKQIFSDIETELEKEVD